MFTATSTLDKSSPRQEAPRNGADRTGVSLSIQECAAEDGEPGIEKNGLDADALLRLFAKVETGSEPLSYYNHRSDLQESKSMGSSRLWRPVTGIPPVLAGPDSDELRIHALVIDVPSRMTLTQLQEKLDGIFAVLHTRYGHRPGREEWRVIIPFAKPVPWNDWANANKYWRGILSVANSQAHARGENWYGLPTVAPEVQEHYHVRALSGKLFDATSLNRRDAQKTPEVDPDNLDDLLDEVQNNRESKSSKQLGSSPAMLHVAAPPPTTSAEKATSVPTGVITTAVSVAFPTEYNFPMRAALDTIDDHQALMRTLRDLTLKITNLREYFTYRQELCVLHLQLNECGLWAPGFRPWPKLPQRPREQCADHEHTFQRDRLVIDTNWLHTQKELVNLDAKREKWSPLFDHAKPFDFDLAEQFAQQAWTNNHRTGEVLCLTPFQQCQMSALRTSNVKAHIETFSKSTRGPDKRSIQSPQAVIRTALARWKERQPNLGDLERLLARAQARYNLGETAPAAQVARLAGFISGTAPHDPKTVSESVKKLENWLPAGGIAALRGGFRR